MQIQEVNLKPQSQRRNLLKLVRSGVSLIVHGQQDKLRCTISTAVKRPKSVSAPQEDVGNAKMKIADVLKRIEKHEESCDKRYEQIQKQLDRLDAKVWGLAVLIIFAPLVHKLF